MIRRFLLLLAPLCLLLALMLPAFSLAQGTDPKKQSILNPLVEVGSPGYSGQERNAAGPRDIRLALINIVRIALGLVGTVVLVLALYSGFLWFTAEGNTDQVETAKSTLRNLIIGWFLIALSYALISFVFRSVYIKPQPGVGTETQSWGDAVQSPGFWSNQLDPTGLTR